MVLNSVIVWIFMGMDFRGTEFHSCADFRGAEFRSCADFHRHRFAGFRTCQKFRLFRVRKTVLSHKIMRNLFVFILFFFFRFLF